MRKFGLLFLLIVLVITSGISLHSKECFGYNDSLTKNLLDSKEYVDPKGFFKILPPAGWRIQEYPDDARGKVAFISPDKDVEFRILAKIVEVANFKELFENTENQAEEIRRRFGAITKVEEISIGGGPAVKVSIEMDRNAEKEKHIFINFMRGKILHNFTYGAPLNKYSKYLPSVELSIETYEPTSREVSDKDIIKHAVAAKIRRAQLDIEMGDLVNALRVVNEGLEVDPINQRLIELKRKIIELRKNKQ